MRIYEKISLTCQCGQIKTINRIPSRCYENWRCLQCAIKAKWATEDYRENRPKPKPKKSAQSSFGSLEHRKKLSEALKGKVFSKEHCEAISMAQRLKWQDPEFKSKMLEIFRSPSYVALKKAQSQNVWNDPSFKDKYQTEEFKAKMADVTKNLWLDPLYRTKIMTAKSTRAHKELMRTIQQDPEYIRKLSLAYNQLPRVSSIQKMLYAILDDLKIDYVGELSEDRSACVIGPWSFDCIVPTNGKTLLIECQGDWIHSLPHKRAADQAKHTYITNYFAESHVLKYLWEHQFASYNGVLSLLKNWLGISNTEMVDFDFSQIKIELCTAAEFRPFLQTYHYLMNAGRGGVVYGAYLDDKLIAVCAFSPPPRQNISIGGFQAAQMKDLSRFCIHPNYQKSNFGSWFISKCIKKLDAKIKIIFTYADSTFNHHGTIYKAANFVFDKKINPDYWYASNDGWVMHKKTLYNRAKNLKMTEGQYAEQFNLSKTYGLKKARFLFRR